MRAFIVEEGTPVYAVSFANLLDPKVESKKVKKRKVYFIEDVAVDPIGKVGIGPTSNLLGGSWASEGFYGFKLPNNSQGYEYMLVHTVDLDIH